MGKKKNLPVVWGFLSFFSEIVSWMTILVKIRQIIVYISVFPVHDLRQYIAVLLFYAVPVK